MNTNPALSSNNGRKKKYFAKELFALKLLGLSLAGNESMTYTIYSLVAGLAIVPLYTLVDIYANLNRDFEGLCEIMSYQMGGLMTMCKVAVLYRNRAAVFKLLTKLEEVPFLPNRKRGGDKEEQLVRTTLLITKVQTYAYWIMSYMTVIGTVIGTVIYLILGHSDSYKLPYGSFTIINTTYSPTYEIVFAYQSVTFLYMPGLFVTVDALIAGVLVHLCYQFKMLQNNIKRLLENSYKEMVKEGGVGGLEVNPTSTAEIDGSTIPWIYLKKSLKQVIEYHLAIIDIATELEEAFRYLFLLVFLGTLLLLCFSVYIASTVKNDPQMVASRISEGISACLQILTVCYWGEEVMHESQLVARAISESNFVGTDLRYQKMLAFIMRRSQNPTKFTAGKFAVIGLATFFWIIRTAYSSFMILRRSAVREE